jgi:hypothetical protein
MILIAWNKIPENKAQAGIVNTHAQTIFLAMIHLTEESLFEAATPMIEVEMIWVVLTGACSMVAVKITAAAPVSAAKPFTGTRRAMLTPMVLIIFQPPTEVPKAIARAQVVITHRGIVNFAISPPLRRAMEMTPIDFWASLLPWFRAINPAEII